MPVFSKAAYVFFIVVSVGTFGRITWVERYSASYSKISIHAGPFVIISLVNQSKIQIYLGLFEDMCQ